MALDDNDFRRGLSAAEGAVRGVGSFIGGAMTAIGTAVIGIGAAALTGGEQFNSEMRNVQAQTQQTGDDISITERRVRDLATEQGRFNATTIMGGLAGISRNGQGAERQTRMLEAGMRLAQASGNDFGGALYAIDALLVKFGQDVSYASRWVNTMAVAQQEFGISQNSMLDGLQRSAGIINTAGLAYEFVASTLAIGYQNGMSMQLASSGLSGIFSDMISPTSNLRRAMSDLGVETIKNTNGTTDAQGSMVAFMRALQNTDPATREQIMNTANLSGANAQLFANLLDNIDGLDGITDMFYYAMNAGDEYARVTRMAADRTGGFTEMLGLGRNMLGEFFLRINDVIGSRMYQWLSDITGRVRELVYTEGGLIKIDNILNKIGDAFFEVARTVGNLARALAPVVKELLPWLIDVFFEVLEMFNDWVDILSPIIEEHLPTFLSVGQRIVEMFIRFVRRLEPIVENLLPPLLELVGNVVNIFLDLIEDVLEPLIDRLLPVFVGILANIVELVNENEAVVRHLLRSFVAWKIAITAIKGVKYLLGLKTIIMGIASSKVIGALKLAITKLIGAKYFGAFKSGIASLAGSMGLGKLKGAFTALTGGKVASGLAGGAIGIFKGALLGVALPITATVGLVAYIANELHKYGLQTKEMGEMTTETFEKMYEDAQTNMGGMSREFQTRFQEIYDRTGDRSKAIRITALEQMDILGGGLDTRFSEMIIANYDFWEEMYATTGNVVTATQRTVSQHYGYMARDAMKEMDAFTPRVEASWNRIYEETGSAMSATNYLVEMGYFNMRQDVYRELRGMQVDARDAGHGVTDGLYDGIEDGSPRALSGVRNFGNSILSAFRLILGISSPSTVFRRYGENIGDGLRSGLRDGRDRINSTIESVGNWLINGFNTITRARDGASTVFARFGRNIVNGTRDGINDRRQNARDAIERVGTAIINGFHSETRSRDGVSTTFARFGRNIVNGARDGINDRRQNARDAIERVGTAIINGFHSETRSRDGASTVFSRFGRNINQGIIDGLNANSNTVLGTIGNIASGIVSGFASALGISSPSRVFMEFGENTTEGYERGISGFSKVNDTIASYASSMITDFNMSVQLLNSSMDNLVVRISNVATSAHDSIRGITSNFKLLHAALNADFGSSFLQNITSTFTRVSQMISREIRSMVLEFERLEMSLNRSFSANIGTNFASNNLPTNSIAVQSNAAQTSQILTTMNALLAEMQRMRSEMNRMQVVLDTGALVGEINPQIDRGLGESSLARGRGRASE